MPYLQINCYMYMQQSKFYFLYSDYDAVYSLAVYPL